MEGIIGSAFERDNDEPGKIAWTAPVLITCGNMMDVMALSMTGSDSVAALERPPNSATDS